LIKKCTALKRIAALSGEAQPRRYSQFDWTVGSQAVGGGVAIVKRFWGQYPAIDK
jgi:hypothetical protein